MWSEYLFFALVNLLVNLSKFESGFNNSPCAFEVVEYLSSFNVISFNHLWVLHHSHHFPVSFVQVTSFSVSAVPFFFFWPFWIYPSVKCHVSLSLWSDEATQLPALLSVYEGGSRERGYMNWITDMLGSVANDSEGSDMIGYWPWYTSVIYVVICGPRREQWSYLVNIVANEVQTMFLGDWYYLIELY